MTTTPVSASLYTSPADPNIQAKNMSTKDFMNLLITQLQNQDPLSPTDQGSMMTQMTQIASIQSMTQMQQGMTQLGVDQQMTLGQQLINKNIQLQDSQGNTVTGAVGQVKLATGTDSSGSPTSTVELQVNGVLYPITDLQSVLPDTTTPANPTPPTP